MDALQEVIRSSGPNLNPIGFIDDTRGNSRKQINGFPVLGSLDSLESILEKKLITEIIVPINAVSQEEFDRLFQICTSHQISLRWFQTLFEEVFSKQEKTFLDEKRGSSRGYGQMVN